MIKKGIMEQIIAFKTGLKITEVRKIKKAVICSRKKLIPNLIGKPPKLNI